MIYYYQKILSHRLLAWAVLSVLAGVSLWVFHTAGFWNGFGVQCLVWGAVDGVVALLGLRGLREKLESSPKFEVVRRDAARLRKILWVNAALDVLYLSGGLWILLKFPTDAWLQGTGAGVLVQGGFLLLFDVFHAIRVPEEVALPDLGILKGEEHQEFVLNGGDPVAILIHGFPGTPAEVREWAQAIHQEGWTVKALLLPGFGADLPNMYQQRVQMWLDKITAEVEVYKSQGRLVLLAGFSMGGGLSIVAAEKSQPHALLLLAPFWLPETIWTRLLAGIVRLFLPQVIYPFKSMPALLEQMKEEAHRAASDVNLDDPHLRIAVQEIPVPLITLEQFRVLSRWVRRSAPRLSMPVCILQGTRDPVVRPAFTQKLIQLMRTPVEYHLVSGEHHTLLRGEEGFEETMVLSRQFVRKVWMQYQHQKSSSFLSQ
ncbi:alpha/beta hydrolase [Anaerolinea sp.]|uniref:alpha/beta hydrolase n=1 Tax=Anaerolinea sp. TaxID=1872519 RepID=UPI002ACDB3A7|nr:alpha/beta fold hydrolase [Anaerolinea sp.]